MCIGQREGHDFLPRGVLVGEDVELPLVVCNAILSRVNENASQSLRGNNLHAVFGVEAIDNLEPFHFLHMETMGLEIRQPKFMFLREFDVKHGDSQ